MVDHASLSAERWNLSFDQADSELSQVLEEYLGALEQGEAVDRKELIASYPELAPQLAECLAKVDALNQAAVGLHRTHAELVFSPTGSLCSRRIGDFQPIREIGRGGMGIVYEAEQLSLNRRVALKTLPLSGLLDDRRIARFKNESAAAASLDHTHIVSVFAVGCEAGFHYYAMQLIAGCSLADLIAHRSSQGTISANTETERNAAQSTIASAQGAEFFRAAAVIGKKAAAALHYAHEQGVIHRDVKPSNLLIDESGEVHVTDFGLAATQADTRLTHSGEFLGTLQYVSPEQAAGVSPVDHRTDVYGLGATLYELVTGAPLFRAENRVQLLRKILEQPAPAVRDAERAVPEDLAVVIDKSLSRDPANRYATARELANDLERFLQFRPVKARRPSLWRRSSSWLRRNRTIAALAAALLSLAISLAVGSMLHAHRLAGEQHSLQQAVYASDVNLAQQLIKHGAYTEAESRLLRWTESEATEAMRGFEWYFLWRQCRENASDASLFHAGGAYDAIIPSQRDEILTSSFHNAVTRWDAETFARKDDDEIATEHRIIFEVTLSPSEEFVACGADDGKVTIWNLQTGALEGEFSTGAANRREWIVDLEYSQDGKYLAAAASQPGPPTMDKTMSVTLWDVQQQRVVQRFESDGTSPRISFSPSGTLYVTNSLGHICLHESDPKATARNSWRRTFRHRLSELPIWTSQLSADGEFLVTGSSPADDLEAPTRFDVWDTNDWSLVQTYVARKPGRSYALDICKDRWLAAGNSQGFLTLIDLEHEKLVATRRGHNGAVNSVRFSPDGAQLASASMDNYVCLWDRERFGSKHSDPVVERMSNAVLQGAIFSNDSNRVLAVHVDGSLEEWDVTNRNIVRTHNAPDDTANRPAIDISPDGNLVAITRGTWPPQGEPGSIELHHRESLGSKGSLIWELEAPEDMIGTRPRFAPDGRAVAFATRKDVRVVTTKGELVAQFPEWRAKCLGFSPDGHWFAYTRGDTFYLHDAREWTEAVSIKVAERFCEAFDFSPDSRMLATGGDHRVTLWDFRSRKRLRQSEPLSDMITFLDYSPDGRRIAAFAKSGTVHLLHAETLQPLLSWAMPWAWMFHGGFSPDGNRFVIGAGVVTRVFNGGPIDELRRLNVGVRKFGKIPCGLRKRR